MANTDEINEITGAVENAVTYPILVKEVNGYGASRSGGNSDLSGGGSLTRTAQGTMRDLLGWRYRADDPKGFLAALNKAVDLKEAEGHTEWIWKVRPFMVQADLGEVTGAQASIYERAKVAIEHALPLLDGLVPMQPDSDKEKNESMRSMVRFALIELVDELGRTGGPRIQRVGRYFHQLLGAEPARHFNQPENVQGQLGELAKRFGLYRDQVLTVAEEQNLTNFLILVDYTNSLFQTWEAQKHFFSRNKTSDKFLGTQLVRLSQALAVIVESVHEAYEAMDSVFFGVEERQVTVLKLESHEPITISDLLGWVEHFAAVEATQIIEDSGKDGVNLTASMLRELKELLGSVSKLKRQSQGLPQAFFAGRVAEAFRSITHYLTEAYDIADEIKIECTDRMQPISHSSSMPENFQPEFKSSGLRRETGLQLGAIYPNELSKQRDAWVILVSINGKPTKFSVANKNDEIQTGWTVEFLDINKVTELFSAAALVQIQSKLKNLEELYEKEKLSLMRMIIPSNVENTAFQLVANSDDPEEGEDRLFFFVSK